MKRYAPDETEIVQALREMPGMDGRLALHEVRGGNSSINYSAGCGNGRFLVKVVPHCGNWAKRVEKIKRGAEISGRLKAAPVILASGATLFAIEWVEGEAKKPENFTDAELVSFVSAYRGFSAKLGPGLIHGDLNYANILFKDGCVTGFLDFEMVKEGLPEDDLLRPFAHRAERLPFWAVSARRRVLAAFAKTVALSGIARERWLAAVSRYRERKEAIRRRKSHLGLLLPLDLAVRARLFKKLAVVANGVFAFPREIGRKTVAAADVNVESLRIALGMESLAPLDVGCASAVFKGVGKDGAARFVKVVGRDRRAELERCAAFSDCKMRLYIDAIDGFDALTSPWLEARHVKAEDMTDGEARNLARAYLKMIDRFESLPQAAKSLAQPAQDFQAMIQLVDGCRVPVFPGKLPARKTPDMQLVHGDMQYRNVAFAKTSPEVAGFFDFDSVRRGDAAADLAYVITDRYRKNISAAARRRLKEILEIFISECPWPRERWAQAIAFQCYAIAAKRLAARPLSVFAAIDAWRRARALAKLACSIC